MPADEQRNEGELARQIELQGTTVMTTVGPMTEAESGDGSIIGHEVTTISKTKRASASTHKRDQQGSKLKDTKSTMTPGVTAAKVSTVKPKEGEEKQHFHRYSIRKK